jgi:hypothetical protein
MANSSIPNFSNCKEETVACTDIELYKELLANLYEDPNPLNVNKSHLMKPFDTLFKYMLASKLLEKLNPQEVLTRSNINRYIDQNKVINGVDLTLHEFKDIVDEVVSLIDTSFISVDINEKLKKLTRAEQGWYMEVQSLETLKDREDQMKRNIKRYLHWDGNKYQGIGHLSLIWSWCDKATMQCGTRIAVEQPDAPEFIINGSFGPVFTNLPTNNIPGDVDPAPTYNLPAEKLLLVNLRAFQNGLLHRAPFASELENVDHRMFFALENPYGLDPYGLDKLIREYLPSPGMNDPLHKPIHLPHFPSF